MAPPSRFVAGIRYPAGHRTVVSPAGCGEGRLRRSQRGQPLWQSRLRHRRHCRCRAEHPRCVNPPKVLPFPGAPVPAPRGTRLPNSPVTNVRTAVSIMPEGAGHRPDRHAQRLPAPWLTSRPRPVPAGAMRTTHLSTASGAAHRPHTRQHLLALDCGTVGRRMAGAPARCVDADQRVARSRGTDRARGRSPRQNGKAVEPVDPVDPVKPIDPGRPLSSPPPVINRTPCTAMPLAVGRCPHNSAGARRPNVLTTVSPKRPGGERLPDDDRDGRAHMEPRPPPSMHDTPTASLTAMRLAPTTWTSVAGG